MKSQGRPGCAKLGSWQLSVLSDKNWAHQAAPLKRVAPQSAQPYRRFGNLLYSRFSPPVELLAGKMRKTQVILF